MSTAPIRCLVIQLARLGDTLQCLMALKAAKELYPNLSICFVARENFSAAARRVSWLDEVITLPSEAMLGPVKAGEKTETQALKDVARWAAQIIAKPWDLAINWTYSEASSYLTALVAAKVKLGYSRRKDRTLSAMDGWSQYLNAVVQGGVKQNIHLTDILTTQLLTALQIHYGDPAETAQNNAVSKGFFSSDLDDFCSILHSDWTKRDLSRRWIAVQLGTAHAEKTWAPEKWGRVAAYILKRHPEYRFVLLGGKGDQARARAFQAVLESEGFEPTSVLNLTGQTDFDLWAAVISGAHWVFSCDTAAIHLASTLGTRILNVSVGPVRFLETGPYGNAHYVIAPRRSCVACEMHGNPKTLEHTCHSDITPEGVYASWTHGATEWAHQRKLSLEAHFSELGWSDKLNTLNVFRSQIREANDGGGVQYNSLCNRPLNIDEWSGLVMEQVARAWYCGWTPPVGGGLNRSQIGPDLVKSLRELEESAHVLKQVCEEATRLTTLMSERSKGLKSEKLMSLQDRSDLHILSVNIHELDDLLHRLGTNHPPLRAFSLMAKVLMHNLAGQKLWEVAEESAISYRQLAEGVKLVHEWAQHSLLLARPKAITLAPEANQTITLNH